MGNRFFRKLLGGQATLTPHVADAAGELGRLAEARPSLKASCAVLADFLPALFAHSVRETPPTIETETAHFKLSAGVPLLRGETLALDDAGLRRRCLAVCDAVRRHSGGAAPEALARVLRARSFEPLTLLAEVVAGRSEAVHAWADDRLLDAALTATVLRLGALPVLAGMATALAPLREGVFWGHGYCPTCGSWPVLSELRGLEQARFLRCGLCASAWEFARLRCPFSGNRDHRQLGFFHVEGEQERFRAATCDACHGYVKTAFTLAAFSEPGLLVADLASLHLDLAAADRGFSLGLSESEA